MDEKKLLSALLKRLDRPNPRFLASIGPLAVLWVVVALFFMLLFHIAQGYWMNPVALAIGSAFLGLVVAWVSICVAWARQWPIIRGHVSRQSVQSRLGELEA